MRRAGIGAKSFVFCNTCPSLKKTAPPNVQIELSIPDGFPWKMCSQTKAQRLTVSRGASLPVRALNKPPANDVLYAAEEPSPAPAGKSEETVTVREGR